MSMLTIGMAEEFRKTPIAVNALWPRTLIATAAIEFEVGGPDLMAKGRKPEIMADAATAILQRPTVAHDRPMPDRRRRAGGRRRYGSRTLPATTRTGRS